MLVVLGSACFLFVGRLGDVSCCHFVPSGVPKLQRWDKAHHVSNVDATLAQRGIGAYACNGWRGRWQRTFFFCRIVNQLGDYRQVLVRRYAVEGASAGNCFLASGHKEGALGTIIL